MRDLPKPNYYYDNRRLWFWSRLSSVRVGQRIVAPWQLCQAAISDGEMYDPEDILKMFKR